MGLRDAWESFLFWRERKKPILQLLVWIIGIAMIAFFAGKEFCEKRIKK